jgi:hypothetical protein
MVCTILAGANSPKTVGDTLQTTVSVLLKNVCFRLEAEFDALLIRAHHGSTHDVSANPVRRFQISLPFLPRVLVQRSWTRSVRITSEEVRQLVRQHPCDLRVGEFRQNVADRDHRPTVGSPDGFGKVLLCEGNIGEEEHLFSDVEPRKQKLEYRLNSRRIPGEPTSPTGFEPGAAAMKLPSSG